MENLFNLLFPLKCELCGKGTDIICHNCLEQCLFLDKQYCLLCDKPSYKGETHKWCFDKFSPKSSNALFEYDNVVRNCIGKAKYSSKKHYLLKKITAWGLRNNNLDLSVIRDPVIVPIPLSKARMKKRGFNQSEVIAKEVAKHLRLTLDTKSLFRTRNTTVQHEKTRSERFKGLLGAFSAKSSVYGSKILLIDDICTTGATLLEASKTLYLAGAKEVRCFCLSKTLKN